MLVNNAEELEVEEALRMLTLPQQQQQLRTAPAAATPEVSVRSNIWDGRVKTLGNFTVGWYSTPDDLGMGC